jgi:hypothetical protein
MTTIPTSRQLLNPFTVTGTAYAVRIIFGVFAILTAFAVCIIIIIIIILIIIIINNDNEYIDNYTINNNYYILADLQTYIIITNDNDYIN